MLGALFQLGERRERVAGLGVERVVDLEEDRAVVAITIDGDGMAASGGVVERDLDHDGALPVDLGSDLFEGHGASRIIPSMAHLVQDRRQTHWCIAG